MKSLSITASILLLFFSIFSIGQAAVFPGDPQAADPTPVPTYDPLAEPLVPENPTELDLGKNWYWHNCMTCHGDIGQGLTDEFRGIWPEDHQNCWAHGCHGGKNDDEGFPIPMYVPPLVRADKLAKFSQESIYAFLKNTHPPQTPGILNNEEYMAIIKYLFLMNDRPFEEFDLTPTAVSTVEPAAAAGPIEENLPAVHQSDPQYDLWLIGGSITAGLVLVLAVVSRTRSTRKEN